MDHLSNLDISLIVGTVKQRIAAINSNTLIHVVNRENVKSLVEYYEKNGLKWPYDMVVIDEDYVKHFPKKIHGKMLHKLLCKKLCNITVGFVIGLFCSLV